MIDFALRLASFLEANPAGTAVLGIGFCFGMIIGMVLAGFYWNSTCKAFEEDAIRHMEIALDANAQRHFEQNRTKHMEKVNEILISMIAESPEIPYIGADGRVSTFRKPREVLRDIQFPKP